MNGEATFQLICKTAVQSEIAVREDFKTQGKRGCCNIEAVDLTSNIPIERLFGPDCIPDDTWGASDPCEGFCMQLTSPASCKKYLKSQWAGIQSTPVDFLTTILLHKSEYKKHYCWFYALGKKPHTSDLLHVLKSCIISKIKAWDSAIKP